jgi:acetyl esterase/lipase
MKRSAGLCPAWRSTELSAGQPWYGGSAPHLGCPPTLLIQGEQDFLVPVDATCAPYSKLVESGVPAINIVLPWTDHAFDVFLPHTFPPAQSAQYDVDRFLALLLSRD